MIGNYKIHPWAQKVPVMGPEDYAPFKEDIKRQGQLFPIIHKNGEIWDGRNRLTACLELGIEPRFQEYNGSLPAEQYILTTNLRRNLTKLQRDQMIATFAPAIIPQVQAEMKERMKRKPLHADSAQQNSVEQNHNPGKKAIAKALGASEYEAEKAIEIFSKAPELLEEVEARGGLRKTAEEARRRGVKKPVNGKSKLTPEEEAENKACLATINAPSIFPHDAPISQSKNLSEIRLREAIRWLREHEDKIASFKQKDLHQLLLRINAVQAYKVNFQGFARPDGEIDERIIAWAQALWVKKERQHKRLELLPRHIPLKKQEKPERKKSRSFDDRFKTFWMLIDDNLGRLFKPHEHLKLIRAFREETKRFFSELSSEEAGPAGADSSEET